MDTATVGRTREEERAILEELSDTRPVGGTDRRWLLAIAGIAAVVCFGFVSSTVAPPGPLDAGPEIERTLASDGPREHELDAAVSLAPPSSTPVIALVRPPESASVTGGLVPVTIQTEPNRKLHVSVTVGDAVLGWHDASSDADGTWNGDIRVFAPRVAVPATVHAIALLPRGASETSATITLNGGAKVVLWSATIVDGLDARQAVAFRGSAPLAFSRVEASVTDSAGRRVGNTVATSRLEAWQAGSAGGGELGLGTVSGEIAIRGRIAGGLVLHLAWRDPVTGAPGEVQHTLDGGATLRP